MVAGRHQVDETDGIRVFDEWTDEVDLSLDPETGRFQKRTRYSSAQAPEHKRRWPVWAGLGLAASALFGSLGAGVAAVALLVGAGGMALAIFLFAPTVEVVLPEPVAPAAVVAPVEAPPVEAAAEPPAVREVKKAPKKAPPAEPAPPVTEPPAAPEVDAQLVVMPDPGFRGKPLDSAIKELDKKANAGKIGVVAGH